MSFRDAAAGGRTFVSDSSASADRRMAGALARIVSQGIAFNARSHGMPMPLSLVDEAQTRHMLLIGNAKDRSRHAGHASGVIENSRIETVLPKHGPTEGADSMPE